MADENLTQLLSKLRVQSTSDELVKVQETCLQLLNDTANSKDHGAILKAYLVASIKQDKYAQGLRVLLDKKEIDDQYGEQFALEKLYIFYKLNETKRFDGLYRKIVPEPVDSLKKKSEEETTPFRGILHVRAQFCYNNAQYEEAFKIYHYLATHNEKRTDNDIELACNERVPLTVEPYLQENATLSSVSDESYDLLFNDSMISSAKGQYNKAVDILKRAREMAASDGYESDLNAIELQLSYVYQLMGKTKDSQELLNKLIEKLDKGSPLALLANMNKKAFCDYSKYKTNLNLVLREVNAEAMNGYNLKHYTQSQWTTINRNLLFLHLFNNDSIQSKSTPLSRTLHKYKETVGEVNLESYKSQAKKLYHRAMKMIAEEPSTGQWRRDSNKSLLGFLLLTLQLQVIEKQWDEALSLCYSALNGRNFPEVDRAYACNILYCIIIDIRRRSGRDEKFFISRYEKNNPPSEGSFVKDIAFWKHVGMYYMGKEPLSARKLFEEISKETDDDFIKKYKSEDTNDVDVQAAAKYTQGIDVAELLSDGVTPFKLKKATNVISVSKVTKKQKVKNDLKKQKQKEQRLKRFLEHCDTSKGPDPERWLPKKDRSTYRPKKKQVAKQTQGGNMSKKAEQALDISKNVKVSKKSKGKRK